MKRYKYYSSKRKKTTVPWELFVAGIFIIYGVKKSPFKKFEVPIISFISMIGIIFLTVIISIYVWKKYKDYKKRKQYLNSRIHEIDTMRGNEFEELLKAHFEKQGYKVMLTPASNDYGADLVLIKDNSKIVVQAKRYKDKVGNKAIQEVNGAIGYYKASAGMVITNSYFTSNAENLAKANNITLWDRRKLIEQFQIK